MGMRERNEAAKMRVMGRRMKLAEHLARGVKSQQALANIWNAENPDAKVSRAQVHRDLVRIREMWTEATVEYLSQAVVDELATINAIESEAWAAWERSKRTRERKRMGKRTSPTDQDGDGPPEITEQSMSIETEEQAGDDRFLARVAWCVERRAKLLGLDAPSVTEVRLPGQKETVNERATTISELRQEMLKDAGYIEYLRSAATDCDTRPVRPQPQSQLAVLPPPKAD